MFDRILNTLLDLKFFILNGLTLSWWTPLWYRNQSTDLQSKLRDWFLYDKDLRHERVKKFFVVF